jgi:ADP-heptose:LPS heptosyltransferase
VKKILFFKLVEQGATVLANTALKRAVEMVGKENVYFCLFKDNRPILDILDIVPPENIFEIRQTRFSYFVVDSVRVLLRIRRIGIDAAVDMEFFARAAAIFLYLTGASRRVGLHSFSRDTPYRGDLLTHRFQYNPHLHSAVAFDLLVRALEHDPEDLPMLKEPRQEEDVTLPVFAPSEEERAKIIRLLGGCAKAAEDGGLVLLNPNASDMLPIRKWPEERFVALGRLLLEQHSELVLAVTGAEGEREAAEKICEHLDSDRVVCLAGRTSLRELMALFMHADVLVTNDSGPAHFAAMTTIDTVVLFGPETPRVFGPLGPRTHVVWRELACSPCVSAFSHRFSPCTRSACMDLITENEVYDVVRSCLAARRTAPGLAEGSS